MSDRRRRQLIDRFQHRLFARIVIYGLVYQATLWNVLFCWRLAASGGGDFFGEYRAFFFDSYPMLVCFLVLIPVFAWDAVKYCNRVAGPIYNVRTKLLDVAAGRGDARDVAGMVIGQVSENVYDTATGRTC